MGFLDGKTEAATPKRRDDARKKGQVAKSREVISVAVLVTAFAMIRSTAPALWENYRASLWYYLDEAIADHGSEALSQGMMRMILSVATLLGPLMVAVLIAGIVGNVAQTGPMLIGQGLKVDFSKISPLAGLKRMVSAQPLVELAKSAAKVLFVGWVVYGWIAGSYPNMVQLCWMETEAALISSGQMMRVLINRTLGCLVVIAAVDYVWQRYSLEKQLMMTRDEVKDEFRQQEGSPEVRGAIRRRQREAARRTMKAAVQAADVLVTNPTHYAVALKYDMASMDAPQVTARGQRLNALQMRSIATEAGVPIVENPPLARALYAACDIGDLIPAELYAAVAEVLAFVYRLKGRTLPRG